MQNSTTTATAPTKCGLKLDQSNFRYAIEKALTLKPRVEYLSIHDAFVASSTGKSLCHVTFEVYEDGLWTMCSCQAGRAKSDYPKACFHMAAAAIDRNLFAVPMPIGAAVEEKHLESLAYDAIHRTEQHQVQQDRFRPQLVRESFGYDQRQVNAQAARLQSQTGWEL